MMATPGQMNVSAAGAFTYSIPIIVPPGTAGMGPALALDYSSQNGDGPEGIGWALTGLPAITRCPRTPAQDQGVHGSVNFDLNDRFCMNGQRLVLSPAPMAPTAASTAPKSTLTRGSWRTARRATARNGSKCAPRRAR